MNRAKNILSFYTLNAIVLMFLILYLLFGCKKLELERTVMVATGSVTNVSYASCSVQGTIIDKGEKGIDQHGFCWAVAQNPTTANNKTQLGSKNSTGNFSGNLTGLSANTTYYVRAYAQNKDGISYGDQKSFSTLAYSLPTVTITPISNITENSAQSGGNITDNGGALVTARGVCWSTSSNPTTADSKTTDGSGTGSFTSSITGLTQNTTYYVRAYATNSVGTAYGNEVNFTTSQTIISPTVTTSSASDIAETSATVGGNVTDDGGATVTARGVCWSTSQNPTITDEHTTDGSGTGSFTSSITGLTQNTTYYVRAYATNSVGTAYGNEVSFTTGQTVNPPVVTTTAISSITQTTATGGGNVTSDGGASVTARGVYYSTSASPETTGTKLQIGSGTGTFSTSLTGLSAGTTYYIKAYATNSIGTSYGSEVTFTTLTTPSLTTTAISAITENSAQSGGNITDDGGASVTARGVCWSTSQNPTITDNYTSDGTGTGGFSSSIIGLSPVTTYYVRAYATNSEGTAYGDEVNFITTTTIPTVTTISASSITENSAESGGNVTDDGGATVTARGVCWNTSSNPTLADSKTTNGSGTGSFSSSITGLSPVTTYYVRAYATNSVGTSYGSEVTFTTLTIPTISTTSVSSITENSAESGGNITDDGGATVTARGVCWSTSQNPTTADSKTTDGSGTGSFTSLLTGLSSETTYYVRAYATNSVGTAYGNEVSFTTYISGETVTDYDGNTYNTVQIGNQVWMAENLKVTHYPDGTAIQLVEDNSAWDALGYTDKAYCYYDNSSTNGDTYGALYTWAASMNGAGSSDANPSGVQGVCPDGWHLPSDAEWKQLEMFLGMSQSEADDTGYRGTDEGSQLAGNASLWTDGSLESDPAFGSSGFTALPGGNRNYNGNFYNIGYDGNWWSSTESNATNAWNRNLYYNNAYINRNSNNKKYGFSVRCVRDIDYLSNLTISGESGFANILINTGDTIQTIYIKNNNVREMTVDSIPQLQQPFERTVSLAPVPSGDSLAVNITLHTDNPKDTYLDTLIIFIGKQDTAVAVSATLTDNMPVVLSLESPAGNDYDC
ncbi:MAG: fibrobacter succinogenes major paralogous domain-containing protein [Bacteroidetes bacterium]|nr:fibrobacter succinogenes major paralogous domain-containing protein [Bacteroidota bacterium]